MNDYDARQYEQMEAQISAYESGTVRLHELIASLEALMDCLQQPDQEWLKEFRKHWAVLEQAYAVASDRGESLRSPWYAGQIAAAIEAMKRCLLRTKSN
jgi:hypothetical protein